MSRWIAFPHKQGTISRQAHTGLPEEAPYEREAGRSGFYGPASHFHHKRPPTSWDSWEGPLRPRAFNLNKLKLTSNSPFSASSLLTNSHCKIRFWTLTGNMERLVRNADGDELLFVHSGSGALFCDYGHLRIRDGDYLVIPRGTCWRLEADETLDLLMIEASNESLQLPEKGLLGAHAIFDQAMMDVPAIDDIFLQQQTDTPWSIEIKRNNQLSKVNFSHNPLDAIGWHGDLAVARINWREMRPISSHRYHLPPSVHTTFVAPRFVVCTFVPRPIETDPDALKVPFYHNNDDFDEVIFYHAGDFFSRDNIDAGMLSFHPCGFTHGPHPKAFAAGKNYTKKHTDEVAVMIDARDPLEISDRISEVELQGYADSWKQT